MAWPKKGTRKIVVDGVEWLWHYSAHCYLCSNDVVTVGQAGSPHHLFFDTFSRDFEHTPGHVAASLRWALSQGWNPTNGGDRAMTAKENSFEWLPEGWRHHTDAFNGSKVVDKDQL
ncbi:hypothetical protein [Roseimicrobium sp. ORNL1]|uniref:hypothetical protein n=1 Tax=Roseimicrobium sp. ORNL1 TaxID=2711231 RepID=UPI0013E1A717|nr:hypothetical protein [Roseimicrobium sp. ORNL1]QIF02049.1 hypothetical protein G5S37_11065 [Roseimicrobium sp. ORNL1]